MLAFDRCAILEILRFTQDDIVGVVMLNSHYVILNGVKNLEVSVAVNGSTSLEILRFTQDDIVGVVMLNAHLVILNSHHVILNGVKNLSVCACVRLLYYPVDPSFHSG